MPIQYAPKKQTPLILFDRLSLLLYLREHDLDTSQKFVNEWGQFHRKTIEFLEGFMNSNLIDLVRYLTQLKASERQMSLITVWPCVNQVAFRCPAIEIQ